ncbi:MAG: class I SAM-dependent methyltransferase [Patescibacteria group bacterium]
MHANEDYQKKLEECSKQKFIDKSCGFTYFGDTVSKLITAMNKKYLVDPIIDVGAGTGAMVALLRRNGHRDAIGIDLCPKTDLVQEGLITDLRFPEASFMTAICTEVLEHLTTEQLRAGLKETFRVLRPGGHLIVTVPFDELLEKNSITCPNCGHHFHRVGHLQSFDKKRMSTLLRESGFNPKKIGVFPFSIMSSLPGSRYYWRLIMRFDKRIGLNKTMLAVARKD